MSSSAMARALVLIVVIGLTWLVTSSFLRHGFPEAWKRWVRPLSLGAIVAGAIGIVGWQGPRSLGFESPLAFFFLTVTSMVLTSLMALTLSSAFWGPLALFSRAKKSAPVVAPGRRRFLRNLSGGLPAAAAATGPVGAVSASTTPVLSEVSVHSRRVPKELDGFQILHLSDVHLGVFIQKSQFEAVVDVVRAAGITPDLLVLTGDIADDYVQLPGALEVLKAFVPKEKIFASIGNHEIYRGRDKAEAIYNEAGVGYLCDAGVVVEKNGARLWLGGADDPARGLDGPDSFLERAVDRCLAACPDDVVCKVVLSHRPRGYVFARERGVTLTLSGHTHGAQMGVFGRSVLAPLWPESFLLGHYRHDDGQDTCHLYTTAGLGHWMPFRLNCPCEAAVITLRHVPDAA